MIRVTVELLRRGSEKDKETLGVAEIANVGGTERSGDYAVRLMGKGGRAWKTGTVEGFPRLRLGGWDLLFRALGGVIAGRNRDVPFPVVWTVEAERPIDDGTSLADAEENDPQAGGPEDPKRKALVEALGAWVKIHPAARARVIQRLRDEAKNTSLAFSEASDALEKLGEVVS